MNTQLLSGSEYFLTYCLDLVRDGVHATNVRFVRWSLLQGGPGLSMFSPAFYSLWTGDDTQVNACISDEAKYITDCKLCDLALPSHGEV